MSSFSMGRAPRPLLIGVLLVALPHVVLAQQVLPSPTPPRLPAQDQLDLQANANVIQGSGARAFGMGGAFLARADDATAASWNPAGLSYLRRPEISFVLAGSDLGAQRHNEQGALVLDDQRQGRAPDFVAFTYPFTIGSTSGAAQVSYQRVLSFDADRTIVEPGATPKDDLVRQIRSRGGFDVIAFGSGWQVSRRLRVGATLNRWIDGYQQTLEVNEPREVPTRQSTHFDLGGWNAHFGVMWSPFDSLNLGAVFKTRLSADAQLKRSRVDTFFTSEGKVQTTNAYSGDYLTLDLPEAVGIGTSWRPRSNLTISMDYTRTRWSTGRIWNFFTLPKTEIGEDPPVPAPPTDFFPKLPYPTLDDPRQRDTSQFRAGGEYVLIRDRIKVPLRAGFFTDDQYFNAAGGPPRFFGLTAGAGLIIGPALLDVAYIHETGSYTSLDLTGDGTVIRLRNDVKLNQLFVSIIYRHPKR